MQGAVHDSCNAVDQNTQSYVGQAFPSWEHLLAVGSSSLLRPTFILCMDGSIMSSSEAVKHMEPADSTPRNICKQNDSPAEKTCG